MIQRLIVLAALATGFAAPVHAEETPRVLIKGLKNPESVALDSQGRVFVSVIGEFNTDGDGGVVRIDGGKAVPFASGFDDPKGFVEAAIEE